jgi:hypothetical protein
VLPDGISDEDPKHIDGPMSKIEDPQDTEGERKARGDQEEKGASCNSAHELVKKDIKRHKSF